MATPQQPQSSLPSCSVRNSSYFEGLDRDIRRAMIEIVQEAMDAIVDHILFVEQSGAGQRPSNRSRISIRFRLQGPLGGSFSDAWSLVHLAPKAGGGVMRRTSHVRTRLRSGRKLHSRILGLCRDWEHDATHDLLNFLHDARSQYALLSNMRTDNLAAAYLCGAFYTPEPIANPKLAARVAATRELRGLPIPERSSKGNKTPASTCETATPAPAACQEPAAPEPSDATSANLTDRLKNQGG